MNDTSDMQHTSRFDGALWLVGFRPFFMLAFISAAVLPLLWAVVVGYPTLMSASALSANQWHAHEMLFGFGWAVLGGFLLTASKNWVGIRGMHGQALFIAALLWVMERVIVALLATAVPSTQTEVTLALSYLGCNLSLMYVGGYVLWTLIRYRKQDSFKDNYFFMVALPLFLVAKLLLLTPATYVHGYSLAVGLFRVAFVVMFERTMTQFMKNAMGIALIRHRFLDLAIKLFVLFSAFSSFMPVDLAVKTNATAGALLFIRFCLWHPLAGLSRFDVGTMYVGYLGLTLHFAFESLRLGGEFAGIGSLSIHVFSFLCMGIIIPSMMIRISQGHTGRKILFTATDRLALGLMGVGAFFRLVATQLWPEHYGVWIGLAAVGWSACFVVIGMRVGPFLGQVRVDGREH